MTERAGSLTVHLAPAKQCHIQQSTTIASLSVACTPWRASILTCPFWKHAKNADTDIMTTASSEGCRANVWSYSIWETIEVQGQAVQHTIKKNRKLTSTQRVCLTRVGASTAGGPSAQSCSSKVLIQPEEGSKHPVNASRFSFMAASCFCLALDCRRRWPLQLNTSVNCPRWISLLAELATVCDRRASPLDFSFSMRGCFSSSAWWNAWANDGKHITTPRQSLHDHATVLC